MGLWVNSGDDQNYSTNMGAIVNGGYTSAMPGASETFLIEDDCAKVSLYDVSTGAYLDTYDFSGEQEMDAYGETFVVLWNADIDGSITVWDAPSPKKSSLAA